MNSPFKSSLCSLLGFNHVLLPFTFIINIIQSTVRQPITLLIKTELYRNHKSCKILYLTAENEPFSSSSLQKCIVLSRMDLFTVKSQEDQHLLEKREPSSNHSQWATHTEGLTRTEIEVDPLQSTSNLSEPTPLMSNTEPTVSQPSIHTQTSSQPSSPQIITPVTTSPHVNVNITLHIGNGSCRTPTFIPTDLMQADNKLPFGEEEESFSTPQQEDGKQSLMSVQESSSYCTEHSDLQSHPWDTDVTIPDRKQADWRWFTLTCCLYVCIYVYMLYVVNKDLNIVFHWFSSNGKLIRAIKKYSLQPW